MKTIVILVYIFNSTWRVDHKEYPMPDMATCIEAAKTAKVNHVDKGGSAVFCATKEVKK